MRTDAPGQSKTDTRMRGKFVNLPVSITTQRHGFLYRFSKDSMSSREVLTLNYDVMLIFLYQINHFFYIVQHEITTANQTLW